MRRCTSGSDRPASKAKRSSALAGAAAEDSPELVSTKRRSNPSASSQRYALRPTNASTLSQVSTEELLLELPSLGRFPSRVDVFALRPGVGFRRHFHRVAHQSRFHGCGRCLALAVSSQVRQVQVVCPPRIPGRRRIGPHPKKMMGPRTYLLRCIGLKRCEQFVGDDVQSDVASLRLVNQSGERLVWIAAVLRNEGSFGHVDLWSRDERLLELRDHFSRVLPAASVSDHLTGGPSWSSGSRRTNPKACSASWLSHNADRVLK